MVQKDSQSVEPKELEQQKAATILRLISIDPLRCVTVQLNRLCWDNLLCLMKHFSCTIAELDKKVLADLQGKSG